MMTDQQHSTLTGWILGQGRRYINPGEFLQGLCHAMRGTGLAIDRATIGVPLLHPAAETTFADWDAEKGLTVHWARWNNAGLEKLRNSPIHAIYTTGQTVDWRLAEPGEAARFSPLGQELFEAGFKHYLAFALPFTDQSFKAFTVQTKNKAGFSESELQLFTNLVPAIATVLEANVQRSLATTLMETYVGVRAGEQVLDGQIARGDGETIRAVIWMSDLRGFTLLASTLAPQALLEKLNQYFGAVSDAITDAGGEVLKFIGDAVLAVFPAEEDPCTAVTKAETAIDAVMSATSGPDWERDLKFGIALHLGEVFYGNVGSRTRLDFTVIGASVNLVSRVEGLCSALGESVLVTTEIAQNSSRRYRSCGNHPLKGVKEPVEVMTPSEIIAETR